jgi:hypothetical protein
MRLKQADFSKTLLINDTLIDCYVNTEVEVDGHDIMVSLLSNDVLLYSAGNEDDAIPLLSGKELKALYKKLEGYVEERAFEDAICAAEARYDSLKER